MKCVEGRSHTRQHDTVELTAVKLAGDRMDGTVRGQMGNGLLQSARLIQNVATIGSFDDRESQRYDSSPCANL
jgi:hypothetical protein